ncbi:hypothetical protein BD289DRAFT_70969 [Coniella lustricola]|uniref:Uncharacterized protein n=1 Tax=Coniella lustricola TaxID=2025994 RepID=A0A2T3A000_9PEZI|nr:hypothetical protein BD289DRAFT_70969 [Coniella lustricola]
MPRHMSRRSTSEAVWLCGWCVVVVVVVVAANLSTKGACQQTKLFSCPALDQPRQRCPASRTTLPTTMAATTRTRSSTLQRDSKGATHISRSLPEQGRLFPRRTRLAETVLWPHSCRLLQHSVVRLQGKQDRIVASPEGRPAQMQTQMPDRNTAIPSRCVFWTVMPWQRGYVHLDDDHALHRRITGAILRCA